MQPIPTPFPVILGYVDPSAGHVFQSVSPFLSGILGIIIGTVIAFFGRIRRSLGRLIRPKKPEYPENAMGSS